MPTVTEESKLTKYQKKIVWLPAYKDDDGRDYQVKVELRFDDECGNGHNSFAITADVYLYNVRGNRVCWVSGGCCHDAIIKAAPEYAGIIKWHLCSTDGPMHYIANTVYHAGDRDCNGLMAGEFRQFTDKVTGIPKWKLEIGHEYGIWGGKSAVTSADKPEPVTFEYAPYGRTGEGKARDLDAARKCAIWPDATDEELTADGLKERLEARLPELLVEFRAAMEGLGFVW